MPQTDLKPQRAEGFIPLSRRLFNHWLWSELREFSRAEAWLDLIRMATFRDETTCVQGRCINLQRGELVSSVRYLAARWGWSKSKVERYLALLAGQRMIETRAGTPSGTAASVLKLSNYERYNPPRDAGRDGDEDSGGTVPGQQRDNHKKDKNPRTQKRKEAEDGRMDSPHRAQKSSVPDDAISDAQWLQSLGQDRAYAGIDIEREYAKMCRWCEVNRRQPSRRRFTNWLNRIERPLDASSASLAHLRPPPTGI